MLLRNKKGPTFEFGEYVILTSLERNYLVGNKQICEF